MVSLLFGGAAANRCHYHGPTSLPICVRTNEVTLFKVSGGKKAEGVATHTHTDTRAHSWLRTRRAGHRSEIGARQGAGSWLVPPKGLSRNVLPGEESWLQSEPKKAVQWACKLA